MGAMKHLEKIKIKDIKHAYIYLHILYEIPLCHTHTVIGDNANLSCYLQLQICCIRNSHFSEIFQKMK